MSSLCTKIISATAYDSCHWRVDALNEGLLLRFGP